MMFIQNTTKNIALRRSESAKTEELIRRRKERSDNAEDPINIYTQKAKYTRKEATGGGFHAGHLFSCVF